MIHALDVFTALLHTLSLFYWPMLFFLFAAGAGGGPLQVQWDVKERASTGVSSHGKGQSTSFHIYHSIQESYTFA